MSLRQKLLLLVSVTVAATVTAVSWTVLVRIKQVFNQRDQQDTALVISQFQREFQHHSEQVAAAVDRLARGEHVRAMAFEIVQSGDTAPYLTEAQTLATQAQLDFLEIVGPDGNVISSAQWPARFGYPEPAAKQSEEAAFLKREDLPDNNTALGLFAMRAVRGAEPAVRLIGGRRLDQSFLADLPVAPGMQVFLYNDSGPVGNRSNGTARCIRSQIRYRRERRGAGRRQIPGAHHVRAQNRATNQQHPLPDRPPRGQRERHRDSPEK